MGGVAMMGAGRSWNRGSRPAGTAAEEGSGGVVEVVGEASKPGGRAGDIWGSGETMWAGEQMATASLTTAGIEDVAVGASRLEPGVAGSTDVGEVGGVRLSLDRRRPARGDVCAPGCAPCQPAR